MLWNLTGESLPVNFIFDTNTQNIITEMNLLNNLDKEIRSTSNQNK